MSSHFHTLYNSFQTLFLLQTVVRNIFNVVTHINNSKRKILPLLNVSHHCFLSRFFKLLVVTQKLENTVVYPYMFTYSLF